MAEKLLKEKYIFYLFIGVNLIPILNGKFFPTLDGAAHLYNSNLINSLIFSSSSAVQDFFSFNPEPVPNWSGHFLLAFFNFFLPAFLAEKILLLLYVIALPIVFRRLVTAINPEGVFLSYFVFPFTYSFVFFLGFYNFSIALVLLFIILVFWVERQEKNFYTLKTLVVLFILNTALYFSHLFVFGILLLLLGMSILCSSINLAIESRNIGKAALYCLKKSSVLLLVSAPGLILGTLYFMERPPLANAVILADSELINWLETIKPIIALNFSRESSYTKILFYLIFAIVSIAIFLKFNLLFNRNTRDEKVHFFGGSAYWLYATLILVVLYFTLPDSNGSAGYVSTRLALLFFLFLILWLSSREYPVWLKRISVTIVFVCHLLLNLYYLSAVKDLNRLANECIKASEKIEPNSVVLPFNYSKHWLTGHFSNYLGIDKPMVILENYEAGTGYFPLIWNKKSIPNTKLGSISSDKFACLSWKADGENPERMIDYIFILGKFESQDSCMVNAMDKIFMEYDSVYTSEQCSLFKRKD